MILGYPWYLLALAAYTIAHLGYLFYDTFYADSSKSKQPTPQATELTPRGRPHNGWEPLGVVMHDR